MTWTVEDVDDSGPGELGESFSVEVGHRRHILSPTGVQVVAITIVAALMFLTFSIFAPHFFTLSNIYTMAQVSSYTFIVAAGLTFLFIAAEIDLSLGANLAFTGVIMGLCVTNYGLDPWIGALCAIVAGLIIGAINGFVVTVMGVQSLYRDPRDAERPRGSRVGHNRRVADQLPRKHEVEPDPDH